MQVFYLHPKDSGYLLSDGDNSLPIEDRQAVKTLYDRLGAFLMGGADDGTLFMPEPINNDLIGTVEARKIAKELGYTLPVTTLNTACDRGTIRYAIKEHTAAHSRWLMPRKEFTTWLKTWIAAKERGSRRGYQKKDAATQEN